MATLHDIAHDIANMIIDSLLSRFRDTYIMHRIRQAVMINSH